MSYLSNAIKSFGGNNKDLGTPIAEVTTARGRHRKQKTDDQLLAEYSGYVYRAIDVKAINLSGTPLFTEQFIGGQWVKRSHPYEQFLEGSDATPDLSWMRTGLHTYKQMFGEAFWYVNVMETSRKPVDRTLLYPNRIKVIANDEGRIVGYVYTTANGVELPLDDDEILHFKYFNPRNHLRGFGPLQAAGLYVDAERNSMEYVATFIENNATPSGIIVLPKSTAEEQFNIFSQQWREKYGGLNNAGKTAILQGEGVDFKQISSTLKDMQLNELRTMSRDDILGVLGMSKHMIGITDEGGLGRSSAEAHEYIFAKHTLVPELQAECQVHNDALKRYFGSQSTGWRVSFDNPVPEDKEFKLQVVSQGATVMSLNERRQLLGLEPVNGGDVITDVFGATIASKSGPAKPRLKVKMIAKAVDTPADVKAKGKEAYRLSIQDKQSKYEREFAKKLLPFFKDQKKRVLENIGAQKGLKALIDGELNPRDEADRMVDLSIALFLDLVQEQGDLAVAFAGGSEGFILNDNVRKFVRESLARTTQDFSDETVRALSKSLAEGLKQGESLMQLGKRVDEYYKTILGGTPDSLKGYRMARLVRTETLKASGEATQFGYEQLGIQQKEWFNNPGACDYCQSLNGGIKGIGENFLARGESITVYDAEADKQKTVTYDYEDINHPPLHPNCRCALLPVEV